MATQGANRPPDGDGPRPDARNGLPGEKLILIDLVDAHGLVIIQTIWATTADRTHGHRLTRFESVTGLAALLQRLAVLAPALCRQDAPRTTVEAG